MLGNGIDVLYGKMERFLRKIKTDMRFINRVIRVELLRILLRIGLIAFAIEKHFHPIARKSGKKLLVIVIGGLGDCLLSDFMFRRLKEHWPDAQIDVFSGCFKEMWERLESIDNLIFFMRQPFKPPWAYVRLFRTIYRNDYDIAVEGLAMLPPHGIYPLLTSFVLEASQAPIRIGRESTGRLSSLRPKEQGFMGRKETERMMSRASHSNNNPHVTHTLHILPPDQRPRHEFTMIFEPLGITCHRREGEPCIEPDPSLDKWAENLLRSQWASKEDIIIGFTTETTRKIKAWPIEHYLSIIRRGITDRMKFVMMGLEEQSADSLFRVFPKEQFLNLSGRTDLGEMMAVINHCDCFFSCDVGPSHVAQACGVPTVVLFGPSNEKEFGPVDSEVHTLIVPKEELPCRPCVLGPCVRGKSCIHSIRPDDVYKALYERVSKGLQRKKVRNRAGLAGKQPQVQCII
jgi:ADP-heptose:LPS heptosyltransferase